MHPEYSSLTRQTLFCLGAFALRLILEFICLFGVFFPFLLPFVFPCSVTRRAEEYRWRLRSTYITYIYLYSFLLIGGKG